MPSPIKTPTTFTPVVPQPAAFQPYGSNNPTLLVSTVPGSPTKWSPEDVKNPTTYTPDSKNPTSFANTWGITTLTYDTLGLTYDDPTVTYDQTQQNVNSPGGLATVWTPSA